MNAKPNRIVCQGCIRTFYTFDPKKIRCDFCQQHDAQREGFKEKYGRAFFQQPIQVQLIPPEMLKRLIQLCHPDKHAGSETSKIAIDWLLKQKEK